MSKCLFYLIYEYNLQEPTYCYWKNKEENTYFSRLLAFLLDTTFCRFFKLKMLKKIEKTKTSLKSNKAQSIYFSKFQK